jgi:hemerythrin
VREKERMILSMRKTGDIIWQDAQHRVLFDILDQIRQPESESQALLRLRDYTENHFALEELYMLQLEYPDLEAHKQAHDKFRDEIVSLLNTPEEPDAAYCELIATFLTEWLRRHVFGTDKKLEDYLLQSGVK